MSLLEASLLAQLGLIAAGVVTAAFVVLLIAFLLLDAAGGERVADVKRKLRIAMSPLALILVVTLLVRMTTILVNRP